MHKNTAALQALNLIFEKVPTVQGKTVKVILEKEVTPEQTRDLAGLCIYLDTFPTIQRAGAGVSVVFAG